MVLIFVSGRAPKMSGISQGIFFVNFIRWLLNSIQDGAGCQENQPKKHWRLNQSPMANALINRGFVRKPP